MAPPGILPVGTICAVTGALTTTGASTFIFALPVTADGQDRTLWLAAIGAGAVPTTVTADLEASFDGGATWQKIATGLALVAASAAAAQKVLNAPRGVPLRINVTTLTLGGASSVAVQGVC